MVRVINKLCDVSGHFGAWLVIVMMPLILIEVFTRYVLGHPLMIADEFSGYVLVALSFIGLAYTWKERGHINLDMVITRLPKKSSRQLRLITLVIALAYSVMLSIESYGFVETSFERHFRSNTYLATPLQVPHITIALGYTILSLFLVPEVIRAAKAVKSTGDIGVKKS